MDKTHILREIKRTALANSGVPLGRIRFAQETGIKESDWRGRFWARWNDAVREAGFEPNQKTTAYSGAFMIEQFIGLMRELGRYPVTSEMSLKALSDPNFPNENTFRRFGSKRQFATRVLEHCKDRAGYEDVVALCEDIAASHPPKSREDVSSEEIIFGFVYLMKFGRYYKIGRSNAAGRRERELAIQLPERINLVHAIRTDDPVGIEAYWHKRFEAKRKNGEWFELTNADVKAFKRRKFM